ncbi:unnamed protein product [Amaranthus hypochondriacus]
MTGNQGKGKGVFRGLLSGNNSRQTLHRGDPYERGVTGFAMRVRQAQAARHSQAQRSSLLGHVRTRFDQQTNLCSDTLDSWDDDTDYEEAVNQEESIGEPVDWNLVRGVVGQFKRKGHSLAGPSDQAGGSQVEDAAPRRRRRSQSADVDWLITSPQPGGPVDTRLIPSYGGHIARVIFEGSERNPPVLECRVRKKMVESIIRLQNMSDELYQVLPASSLGRLPYIMHQHIDSALIAAFVERWQPDTNTFHMPWGEMTVMLHDVQRILGIGIDGALPDDPADSEWKMSLAGLFGEPMAELRRKGVFIGGSINVSEILQLCHRSQSLDTQTTAYYMSIVGSTLLADMTKVGMRPHPILAVDADQDEIAWGAVTLAYLYRQLGMASRAGCRTIAGCLTLLQTWIYEYFPSFRPHTRLADIRNKTRAEMWSPQKPTRELSRLRDYRSILDSMTETQVEWTPYNNSPRVLLSEHPRTAFIGGITCFDIVEVYLPERTVRQLGFVQTIPVPPLTPTQAHRPAQGAYSLTFPSTTTYTLTWSRFPYCARVGDQELRRADVPSEAVPEYIDWFRSYSHAFIIPGNGPNSVFASADNKADYFLAEFPARVAPLIRMGPVANWLSRDKRAAEGYLNELRDLFDEWETFKDGAN